MKIPPALSINKKCHNHQRFLASKCEWGFPKLPSNRCCQPPWWLLSGGWGMLMQKSSHLPLLQVNKENRIWLWVDEMHMEGMNSVRPEACLFPYIESETQLDNLIFNVQTACSLCYKLVHSLISPPAALQKSLRTEVVSWTAVLILSQTKLNEQLSICAFF